VVLGDALLGLGELVALSLIGHGIIVVVGSHLGNASPNGRLGSKRNKERRTMLFYSLLMEIERRENMSVKW
jgi:hypothetical protein